MDRPSDSVEGRHLMLGAWIEGNLKPLIIGFAIGAPLIEAFSSTPFIWIVGGLAGIAVALPISQINKRRPLE
jgi:hypothetical protein